MYNNNHPIIHALRHQHLWCLHVNYCTCVSVVIVTYKRNNNIILFIEMRKGQQWQTKYIAHTSATISVLQCSDLFMYNFVVCDAEFILFASLYQQAVIPKLALPHFSRAPLIREPSQPRTS